MDNTNIFFFLVLVLTVQACMGKDFAQLPQCQKQHDDGTWCGEF